MAQVYVWLPSRGENGINVGHASLLADRADIPAYVSWWPNGRAGKAQPLTSGHYYNTFESDVQAEGGPPLAVELPFLHDQSIADWWNRIKHDGFAVPYSLESLPESNDYHLYSNNCSTIVYQAMVLGGAMEVLPCPRFDTIAPPYILTWANALAAAKKVQDWFSMPFSPKRTGP